MNMIRPPFENPLNMGIELVFSAVIIALCLIIYFKTKEAFNLTKHKGIYYFRNTFVFLALAYLFRLSSIFFILSSLAADIRPRFMMMPFPIIFIGFFSTMAIISLFLSTTWREFQSKYVTLVLPVTALAISIASFISREPLILVSCQATLLLLTALLSLKFHRKSAKFSKLFAIYILLFFFWILGLVPLSSRRPIPHEYSFVAQIISFLIFIAIFYKLHKWIK